MSHMAWAPKPQRVRRTMSRGPKGLQQGIRTKRSLRVLVLNNSKHCSMQRSEDLMTFPWLEFVRIENSEIFWIFPPWDAVSARWRRCESLAAEGRVPGGGVRAALYSYCSRHAYRWTITLHPTPHTHSHTPRNIFFVGHFLITYMHCIPLCISFISFAVLFQYKN